MNSSISMNSSNIGWQNSGRVCIIDNRLTVVLRLYAGKNWVQLIGGWGWCFSLVEHWNAECLGALASMYVKSVPGLPRLKR